MKKIVRKSVTWLLIFGMVFTPLMTSIDLVSVNADETSDAVAILVQDAVDNADAAENHTDNNVKPVSDDSIAASGNADAAGAAAETFNTAAEEVSGMIDSMNESKAGDNGKGQLTKADNGVDTAAAAVEEANGLVDDANDAIDAAEEQKNTVLGLLEGAEEKKDDAIEAIDAVENKETGLKKIADDKLETADSAKETADNETSAALDAIEETLKNTLDTNLETETTDLQKAVKATEEASQQALDVASEQLENAKKALKDATDAANKASNDYYDLSKEELAALAGDAEKSARNANQAVKVAQAAVDAAKENEVIAEQKVETAQNALEKAREDAAAELAAYKEKIAEANALLADANEAREDVREAMEAANSAIQAAINAINNSQASVTTMNQLILAANTAIQTANAKIAALGKTNKANSLCEGILGDAQKNINNVSTRINQQADKLDAAEEAYDEAIKATGTAKENAEKAKEYSDSIDALIYGEDGMSGIFKELGDKTDADIEDIKALLATGKTVKEITENKEAADKAFEEADAKVTDADKEALKEKYAIDENGDFITDENGKLVTNDEYKALEEAAKEVTPAGYFKDGVELKEDEADYVDPGKALYKKGAADGYDQDKYIPSDAVAGEESALKLGADGRLYTETEYKWKEEGEEELPEKYQPLIRTIDFGKVKNKPTTKEIQARIEKQVNDFIDAYGKEVLGANNGTKHNTFDWDNKTVEYKNGNGSAAIVKFSFTTGSLYPEQASDKSWYVPCYIRISIINGNGEEQTAILTNYFKADKYDYDKGGELTDAAEEAQRELGERDKADENGRKENEEDLIEKQNDKKAADEDKDKYDNFDKLDDPDYKAALEAKQRIQAAKELAEQYQQAAENAQENLENDIENENKVAEEKAKAEQKVGAAKDKVKELQEELDALVESVKSVKKDAADDEVALDDNTKKKLNELNSELNNVINDLDDYTEDEIVEYGEKSNYDENDFEKLAAKLTAALKAANEVLEEEEEKLADAIEKRKEAEKIVEKIKEAAEKAKDAYSEAARRYFDKPDEGPAGGETPAAAEETPAFVFPTAGAASGVAGVRRNLVASTGDESEVVADTTGEKVEEPTIIEEEELPAAKEPAKKTTTIEEDELPAAPAPEKTPFPWWILLIIAAIALGYGGYKYYEKKKDEDKVA